MSCDLIIPARAGSKGVPGKNIKPLNGIPLIAHLINAAKGADCIDNIYVSTDGDEIAKVAEDYGAHPIKRPADISGDFASSESAILHTLDVLDNAGKLSEYTFFAQCTAPLTQADDLDRAMKTLKDRALDSVFAAKSFHGFIWGEDQDGNMKGLNHDHTGRRLMRQEMPPQYQETGSFYLFKTQEFRNHKQRFFGKIGVCEIPEDRSIDIDTLEDFARAENYLTQNM